MSKWLVCAISSCRQVEWVTPAHDSVHKGVSNPLVVTPIQSSIKGQRLFITPMTPADLQSSSTTSSAIASPATVASEFEILDAELDGFEALLKSHFKISSEVLNHDIEELEQLITAQVSC